MVMTTEVMRNIMYRGAHDSATGETAAHAPVQPAADVIIQRHALIALPDRMKLIFWQFTSWTALCRLACLAILLMHLCWKLKAIELSPDSHEPPADAVLG